MTDDWDITALLTVVFLMGGLGLAHCLTVSVHFTESPQTLAVSHS